MDRAFQIKFTSLSIVRNAESTTCKHRPPHKICKPATSVFIELESKEIQNIIRENARLGQRVSTRRSLVSHSLLAFQYDPTANYSDNDNLDIGPMTTVCRYCNALKFKRETAGLCCASGKVKLDPLLTPPQPLKPLFDGTDPDFNHFLQCILEYNNCFRMTSFGANIIREDGFILTCKVRYNTHNQSITSKKSIATHNNYTYTTHNQKSHPPTQSIATHNNYTYTTHYTIT